MELLRQLDRFMDALDCDYAVCGGHAIDLFLGHKTRPHKDLDVAMFEEDRDDAVNRLLGLGWELYEPCGGACLHKIRSADRQLKRRTNIWCLRPGNRHYRITENKPDLFTVEFDGAEQTELDFIELLFNRRLDGDFLYARNPAIRIPLDRAILQTEGIRFLAPDVVLLYKSSSADNRDYQNDFSHAAPLLPAAGRQWLKNALQAAYPDGHRWLSAL